MLLGETGRHKPLIFLCALFVVYDVLGGIYFCIHQLLSTNHCSTLSTFFQVKSEEKFVYRKVKASLKFVYKGQIKVAICIHFVYNCTHFFSDKGRVLYTIEIILGDKSMEIFVYLPQIWCEICILKGQKWCIQ